jgi:PPP family 3-phenylpropionic acid transporter
MASERRPAIVAYALLFFGGGIMLPYVPLYLAHLGLSGAEIGVLTGMQPILRWIAAIGWAYVADRWRIRRRVIVATAIVGGLGFVPFCLVRDFWSLALVIAWIGLLHGALIPLTDATVMDHLARLGGDYGRVRLWGSVAFVVAALASAPAVHAFGAGIVPFLVLAPVVALPPALARLPAEQLGHVAHFQPPWRLATPPMRALLAAAFLVNASAGAWVAFFALHVGRLGLSNTVPGVAWGVAVTAEVVLLFAGSRLLGRFSAEGLIVLAGATSAVRWAVTAVAPDQLTLVAAQAGQAFTFGALHLAALALVARLVPAASSTSGQALYGLVGFGLGGSGGMLLGAALIDRIGTAPLFAVEAAIAAAAVIPALRLRALLRRQ